MVIATETRKLWVIGVSSGAKVTLSYWSYLQPVDIKSRWRHNWKSAQVVNSHLVCDPTIRQPGFDLPRQQWSLLNRFHTEQGHCSACRRNWRPTDTDLCPCAETQTMFHIVESCPLTKLNGSLSRLHSADEYAVSWLTSYGSWNAYEKKKKKTDQLVVYWVLKHQMLDYDLIIISELLPRLQTYFSGTLNVLNFFLRHSLSYFQTFIRNIQTVRLFTEDILICFFVTACILSTDSNFYCAIDAMHSTNCALDSVCLSHALKLFSSPDSHVGAELPTASPGGGYWNDLRYGVSCELSRHLSDE